jgi:hypothetical protein
MYEMTVNKNTSGPSSILRTTCASHTLSNNVLLILLILNCNFKMSFYWNSLRSSKIKKEVMASISIFNLYDTQKIRLLKIELVFVVEDAYSL